MPQSTGLCQPSILDEPDRVALSTIITIHKMGAVQAKLASNKYTGEVRRPDEADHELMRMFFRLREFVCLVLQPFSRRRVAWQVSSFWN